VWGRLASQTVTANSIATTATLSSGTHGVYQSLNAPLATYIGTIEAKPSASNFITVAFNTGAVNSYCSVTYNVSTGVVTQAVSGSTTGTIISTSCVPSSDGYYLCSMTFTLAAANINVVLAKNGTFTPDAYGREVFAATGANSESVFVRKADLRLTSEAATLPTYQPITSSWLATIPGNHASQPISAARPVLSARYNLLTYTEAFDNAAWTEAGIATITPGSIVAPDGTLTAEVLTANSGSGAHCVYSTTSVTAVSGVNHTLSVRFKKNTNRYVYIAQAATANNYISAVFDLDGGGAAATQTSVGATSGTLTSTAQSSLGSGWYEVSITGSILSSSRFCTFGFAAAAIGNTFDTSGNVLFAVGGTESIYIWGADLRVANDGVGIPSYQRVGAAIDYDTTGFPLYLKFDGVDDCLYTSSINFTATDKMTVWSGVRKLSDAVTNPPAAIAELTTSTASNNGAFLLSAPNTSGSASYSAISKGTAASTNTVTTYTAPITNVLSAALDIGSDGNSVKVNAGTAVTSATDQGTGNFSNAVLYVGRRGNSASFTSLNGRLYSLIVRGAESTETQITQTETWVNGKTKAY